MTEATLYLTSLRRTPRGLSANTEPFDEELLREQLRAAAVITLGPARNEAHTLLMERLKRLRAFSGSVKLDSWVILTRDPMAQRLNNSAWIDRDALVEAVRQLAGSSHVTAAVVSSEVFEQLDPDDQERLLAGPIAASVAADPNPTDEEVSASELLAANHRRLMAARADMLQQVGVFSSGELAALRGSASNNVSQLGRDLRQAGKVLAVRHGKAWHYPRFQFDKRGTPYREMAEVLDALGEKATPWDVLGWFFQPNEHLDGRSPLEAWSKERASVVRAAQNAHWFARD